MKVLTTIATLLVATSSAIGINSALGSAATFTDIGNKNTGLSQLIASTFHSHDHGPRIMSEVANGTNGTYIEDFPFSVSGEALKHISGWYHNTTRVTKEQHYTYMWKHQCAFTKWIPTNQYLAEHPHENYAEKDFSRFGMIGADKKCYWGLIAVLWKKPLPVWQPDRENITLQYRGMELGFPGREQDGQQILQTENVGTHARDSKFDLHRVIHHENGSYSNLYMLYSHPDGCEDHSCNGDQVLDVLNGEYRHNAYLIKHDVDFNRRTQYWDMEYKTTQSEYEWVRIEDPSHTYCVTRVNSPVGLETLQLKDHNMLQLDSSGNMRLGGGAPPGFSSGITYENNVQLQECDEHKAESQYWGIVELANGDNVENWSHHGTTDEHGNVIG